jgi:hypothetical protein
MKRLLATCLAAALLAGCAGSGFSLPEGSGQSRIEHRIANKQRLRGQTLIGGLPTTPGGAAAPLLLPRVA